MIGKHCVVRTVNAGVFAGVLASRSGDEAVVRDARRMWYWDGAASLSELSQLGVSKPHSCKFPAAVPEVLLLGVVEIIPMSAEAVASIVAVPVWSGR